MQFLPPTSRRFDRRWPRSNARVTVRQRSSALLLKLSLSLRCSLPLCVVTSARAQAVTNHATALELGADAGAAIATADTRGSWWAAPVSIRAGWLDLHRRASVEVVGVLNDQRYSGASRSFATRAQIGVRLGTRNNNEVPFARPFLTVGGSLSSLRRTLPDVDAPRWRFLPSIYTSVGTRRGMGPLMLRTEAVASFDWGNGRYSSRDFLPARRRLALNFGLSMLRD